MKRVLIYSRSEQFRALVSGLLMGRNVQIGEVGCIDELADGCMKQLFDCVIVDDVRLFMDGLCPICRIRPPRATRPQIIVLSHDLTETTVTALLAAGVNQYISLPVNPSRLQEKVCGGGRTKMHG